MTTYMIHTNYAEDYRVKVGRQEGTNADYIDFKVDGADVTLFMTPEQMIELSNLLMVHYYTKTQE